MSFLCPLLVASSFKTQRLQQPQAPFLHIFTFVFRIYSRSLKWLLHLNNTKQQPEFSLVHTVDILLLEQQKMFGKQEKKMMNRLSDKLKSTSTTAELISDKSADQLLSASLGWAPLAVPLQCQIFFGVTAIYLEEKLA